MNSVYPQVNLNPEERLDAVQEICRSMGIEVSNRTLLRKAMTHSSYSQERLDCNERLEFFGDSILGMVISKYIFEHFPAEREGGMSELKSRIVSGEALSAKARFVKLDELILLGKGVINQGRLPDSILADAFEALTAAIYLDKGLEAAETFILKQFEEDIREAFSSEHSGNYKSILQESVQKEDQTTPIYSVEAEAGPDHDKTFFVAVRIDGRKIGYGEGRNKKEAEQAAARSAIENLNVD